MININMIKSTVKRSNIVKIAVFNFKI